MTENTQTTPGHEFTDEQIEQGIASALAEQNIAVVPSLIALLAAQNPERAELVRQTILLGLSLATNGAES